MRIIVFIVLRNDSFARTMQEHAKHSNVYPSVSPSLIYSPPQPQVRDIQSYHAPTATVADWLGCGVRFIDQKAHSKCNLNFSGSSFTRSPSVKVFRLLLILHNCKHRRADILDQSTLRLPNMSSHCCQGMVLRTHGSVTFNLPVDY